MVLKVLENKLNKIIVLLGLFISINAFALKTANFSVISNGNMSGSLTSSPIFLDQKNMVSVQAVYTGAPNGAIKLQVSNDAGVINYDGSVSGVTNWTDYTGAVASISSAGSQAFDVTATSFRWMQVVYVFSSGNGTLNVRVESKGD
jgi:hypothetical protein